MTQPPVGHAKKTRTVPAVQSEHLTAIAFIYLVRGLQSHASNHVHPINPWRPGELIAVPKPTFSDKLLPDQPLHANLFEGDRDQLWQGLYDTIARTSGLKSPYEEFDLVLSDRFTIEEMASNPVSLGFLQLLIQLSGARRVLEIGAFIGVSAMAMAQALPAGGELVTIEKFDHFATISRSNFARNGLADRIRLLEGDADTIIDGLPQDGLFDLIFIDGHKESYGDYFERLEPLLAPGGLFVVDDVFFHGDVLNDPPRTDKGLGVHAFLERAAAATSYRRILLPLANGMMLLMKPREQEARA